MFEDDDQIDEECEGDLQENEEDELDDDEEAADEEQQMDYYMQQHPDLLLALDIAAFRRQQMQQRIQANNSTNAAAASRRRDDLEEEADEAAFLRNQRLNLYGNLALASGGSQGGATQQYAHSASNSLGQEGQLNLGLSMGVNIGTYGYQAGTGNLLQQLNVTGPANEEEKEGETQRDQEQEQEDCEDEEEEFESQDEEDDPDDNDDEDADEEGDDIVDEEENDLECYLRNVSIENGRIRARTAPLRPMEQIEQFKMTPNFTNLEQAAVCAVQIVQRNDQKFDLDSYEG